MTKTHPLKAPRTTSRPRRALRRFARAAQRGMTLVEIMIVVVIMGLITSAVGIAVFDRLKEAKVKTCEQEIRSIENAVELWQSEHRGCPSMAQLREDRALDRRARDRDPWDNEYLISCEGGEARVHSKGPDGAEGTDDDVPRRRARN
ncbi:MAG: type II secretion system protein GspG [Myxococcales bacterium]|nr:type II secretion system protein GspG [Myxococcales bacterium]